MAHNYLPMDQLLALLEKLANQSLPLWDVPEDAKARLINVSLEWFEIYPDRSIKK